MRKKIILGSAAALTLSLLAGCSSSNEQATEITELTIYSGRSEEYIGTLFGDYEKASGIKINVRYGDSAELSAQILEEGSNSPADLFIAQDAGSLGAIAEAKLFTVLPAGVAADIPTKYIDANRNWVGMTGRTRVFAYAPDRVKVLPLSVADLTKPIYKDQIGIAAVNASFQAFVTAMIEIKGRPFTKTWLEALKANGVKLYQKNSMIVEAIDKGEISIGLVNNYYVFLVAKALGRDINVKNGYFTPGDVGNLINVSGAGVMASSLKQRAAEDLINYLTSAPAQQYVVNLVNEYSLLDGAKAPIGLTTLDAIGAPSIDLDSLKNVKVTQDLLIEVGLL